MSTHRIVTTISIVLVALALLASSTFAWDGHRKGIVAGIGGGFAPAAHLTRDARDYSSTQTGFAVQAFFGYALSDHFLLAYDGNLAFVRPDYVNGYSMPGLRGPSVYWYPGTVGKTLFLAGGVGRLTAEGAEFRYGIDVGLGYELGVGYEPMPHLQIGAFYTGGSATYNGYTWRDDIVKILVTVVGY